MIDGDILGPVWRGSFARYHRRKFATSVGDMTAAVLLPELFSARRVCAVPQERNAHD
jgi:hypothetical protein